jgi:dTDP-4-amino-4,6-dideoxygalactose transaminase
MVEIKIPLSYNEIDGESLQKILQQYQGVPHQKIVDDFEMELTKHLGEGHHVVSLNSGTSALHLALLALGVSSGDLVVVPTFTYVGSVNPIYYIGARPVFIDSEMDTWNIDPALLEECLRDFSSKSQLPKAVIVVHTYGMPAKMNELKEVCKHYQVPIVEDAAEALGASYFGKPAGTLGDIGVLSFNSNKTITTFGGGAVVTHSAQLAEKIKFWASQAREPKPYYAHHEVGFNYRLSPLNAAYGLSQLPHLTAKVLERRKIYEQYRFQLEPHGFGFLKEPEGHFSSQWLSTVLLKYPLNPLEMQAKFQNLGIETRPFWNPMHCQPAFVNEKALLNGIATGLFERGLCLPSMMVNTSNVEETASGLLGF